MVIDATATFAGSNEAALTTRVRTAGWCILTLAGLVDSIYSRHAMQSDGISYLDMGDALVRGDWTMGINAYWSPLYPWLQGMALRLLKPSAYSQFAVVHFVNFLIYLFTLWCFDFLLRAAVGDRSEVDDIANENGALPSWAVLAVGYAVFLWSSLSLIGMERVSPDLLMAGFLYLAVGLLLRLWAHPQSYFVFIALGAALGLGYLAKVPFFPLAFLFFAVSWMLAGGWRRATPRVVVAALIFLAISAPWIVALSRAKGRLTFGDSGKVNYVFLVNHATPSWYFQDLGTAAGHYSHPVRKIFDAPPIYEFATPVRGTIPVWYDPSYWADGAVPRVSLRQQLSVVRRWVAFYLDLLFTSQAGLLVGFVVLCFMAGRGYFLKQIAARWPIWLIGLAGLAMYAMVFVELRYIAAFFALFWVGLFSGLKMPPGRESLRLVSIVTFAVVIAIASPVAISTAGHLIQTFKGQPHNQWRVAQDLSKLGVVPGDRVARMGGRFGTDWARLLGVTVVAEVPHANARDFWCGKPEVQAQVIATFHRLGVTAIVAEHFPLDAIYAPGPEWQKLGDGTFHALRLTPDRAK
jgi:4-amino-4-deoxy-L-arabinose transferase-like glycosyltransferase